MPRVERTNCSKCGAPVIILTTRRNKRVPVNPHPVGHDALRYRSVERTEEYYDHGAHQIHFATCTKRNVNAKSSTRRRYV